MQDSAQNGSPAAAFARPGSDDVWLGPVQRAALDHIFSGTGHKYLSGPPSCGKTTVLRYARAYRPHTMTLLVPPRRRTASDVLAGLLVAAGLSPSSLSEIDQRNLLTVLLQQRRSQHKRVIVLIDDAHRLEPAARAEIERLSRLDCASGPLIEIVATLPADAAQPLDLGAEVGAHAMPALGTEDLRGYLQWRRERAVQPFELTDDAIDLIRQVCDGRYDAADTLCRMALLVRGDAITINATTIRNAVDLLAAQQRRFARPAGAADEPRRAAAEARKIPTGRMLVMRNDELVQTVSLRERLLLGRGPECDVNFPSTTVSRFHAVIVGTATKFFIIDLGSTNGVLLNGMPVGKVDLRDQDLVSIGPFTCKIEFEAVPEAAADDATCLVDTEIQLPSRDAPLRARSSE